jgi:hypothetical protein
VRSAVKERETQKENQKHAKRQEIKPNGERQEGEKQNVK